MLPFYFYLELEGFAFIVCFLVYLNLRKKHNLMADEVIFKNLIFANMTILVMDMLTWCCDGKVFPLSHTLLTISNVCYYIISSVILFLWMWYVSLRLNKKQIKPTILAIVLVPLIFEVIMSLTAPVNGLYFYIDSANFYHRGPWCWTQAVIGIVYMLYSSTIAMVRGVTTKDLRVRNESLLLVLFTVFPLICSVIQSQFFGLPLIWIGTTVSFLIFFMQTQNSQLSIDALTKMNNRGKFDVYLSQSIKDIKKNDKLYLVVIDIDKFKTINDTYGHVEGDEALIEFADILKKACMLKKDFSARYGGDEFVLVCKRSKEEPIDAIINEIECLISERNKQTGKPYLLSISYGIAGFTGNTKASEDELKRKADENMYEMKVTHNSKVIKEN